LLWGSLFYISIMFGAGGVVFSVYSSPE